MSYDGNGVFNRLYSWRTDAANSIPIDSTRMDAEMDGMAVGLSSVMTRDGQAPMIANLPMGNKRIINMSDPVNPQDGTTKSWVEAAISGGLPTAFPGDIDFTADSGRLAFGDDLTPDNEGDIQLAWEDGGKGIFGSGFKMSGGVPVHSKDTTAIGGFDFGYGIATMFASTVNTFAGESPIITGLAVDQDQTSFFIQGNEAAKVTTTDNTMTEDKEVVTLEKLEAWFLAKKENEMPIGHILITENAASPDTYLGFGTWVASGEGRAIVGVGTVDGETWDVGDEKGANKHTLSIAELPPHNHPDNIAYGAAGTHNHDVYFDDNVVGTTFKLVNDQQVDNMTSNTPFSAKTSTAPNHTHPKSGGVQNTGSGAAHNNIQPSIAYYIWKRTA